MTYSHRISADNKSGKETAKLINKRRRQSLKWLARKDKKKQSEAVKK